MEDILIINILISSFLDEQVLAFFKLISHRIAENPISIHFSNMKMHKMGEQQRASVNQFLEIFREEKSPAAIRQLNCRLANIQYIPHVDNQMTRLYSEAYEESDIPHLMTMLASPRPDGQQRVMCLNISGSGDLKKEILKAIKKVLDDTYVTAKLKTEETPIIEISNFENGL
jgi:hypothetical protein